MTISDLSQPTTNNESPDSVPNDIIVKLNVGGNSFATFHSTLIKSKYFANLLNEDAMASKTLIGANEIFIDRSGDLFHDILYYLRTGSVTTKNNKKFMSLQKEAEFYQLQELADLIARSKEQRTQEAKRRTDIFACDLERLNASSKGARKYIIFGDSRNSMVVYEILGIIDVLGPSYCNIHRKHNCTDCPQKKLLLRPSSKTLA